MFQDEAGFGRINKPKYCWCFPGLRPTVPCHHIREYRYAYGAVEPLTGDSFFLVMPYCNTNCMNIFLSELSESYPDDKILLVCDGAAWHKAKALFVPGNIQLIFLPPYTPEMNPIEQIWKEIRKVGFRNEIFATLDAVIILSRNKKHRFLFAAKDETCDPQPRRGRCGVVHGASAIGMLSIAD
jgi:putative transposase